MEANGHENVGERKGWLCLLFLHMCFLVLFSGRTAIVPEPPPPQFISHAISILKGSSVCYKVHTAPSTPCTALDRISSVHTMVWL